jgi:hypothetical protein
LLCTAGGTAVPGRLQQRAGHSRCADIQSMKWGDGLRAELRFRQQSVLVQLVLLLLCGH